MDLKLICEQTIHLAKLVGQEIKGKRNGFHFNQVESKGLHDFVSHVDKEAEARLIEGLSQIMPGSGFIAEEGSGNFVENGYNWIVDPLDGTTNFIHGLTPYAVSIALSFNNEIVLGVIYEVSLDECFYSWKGALAYLNGAPIAVSQQATVNDSLIATGFPYYNYSRLKQYMKTMEFFMQHSHGLRRLGSAATDLAYVACGRFEVFYEYSLQPWDVAAGAFLVQQAGGEVSDFEGGQNYIYGKEIIASNKLIYKEFLNSVAKIMNE